ncbi:MAG: hypothetical protein PHF37_05265, partial [Phycisphaerae bacterium]|nr:hypothetical protein [Phycisphaerae bacterium]
PGSITVNDKDASPLQSGGFYDPVSGVKNSWRWVEADVKTSLQYAIDQGWDYVMFAIEIDQQIFGEGFWEVHSIDVSFNTAPYLDVRMINW